MFRARIAAKSENNFHELTETDLPQAKNIPLVSNTPFYVVIGVGHSSE